MLTVISLLFQSCKKETSNPVLLIVNNSTAGNLYSSLPPGYFKTITTLILSGNIDVRDFIILRDSMPNLSVLLLTNANISAYTYKLGTANADSLNYPANAIPDGAFYNIKTQKGKTSLTAVAIPSTVTIIGNNAFNGCTALKAVTASSISSIGSYAFYNCSVLSSFTVQVSVSSIGNYAFANCKSLNSVSIPAYVSLIDNYTFDGCKALITVNSANPIYSSINGVLLDKSEATIIHCPLAITGDYEVPLTVTSIANNAFNGCSGITSISFPSILISLGNNVFIGCTNINSITVNASKPIDLTSSINVFSGINTASCVLNVPQGSKAAYQSANQWSSFTNIVEF
jgi:hypothetical protein